MYNPKSLKNNSVQIITGFATIRQTEIDEMGISGELAILSSLLGKGGIRLSVPTIAPVILGTYLKEKGLDVEIIDFYLDNVENYYPSKIVGISSTFMNIENVSEIVEFIKQKNEQTIIILGGPLSWSVSPDVILKEIPEIDYIVMQEGEETFYELIIALNAGEDVSKIKGIAFFKNGNFYQTEPRKFMEVEKIPLINWELAGIPSQSRIPVLPVETSRGCLYNCAYCSEVHYWGKPPRYFPIEKVVNQLRKNIEQYGISTFRFTDSCFSAPVERCMNLCDAIYNQIICNGANIKWSSYARINNLDYKLLEAMKRSGCVALDIGVESGSNNLLNNMHRGYTTEHIKEIAQIARELDIITNFNIVIGFPGETDNTIKLTAELINEARPDTFSCFQLFIAPHSNIYKNKEKYGIEGNGLNWKHDTMNSSEAKEAINKLISYVDSSCSFPGGEYCACYLSSLGYSSKDIRNLFKLIVQISKMPDNPEAKSRLNNLAYNLKKYL